MTCALRRRRAQPLRRRRPCPRGRRLAARTKPAPGPSTRACAVCSASTVPVYRTARKTPLMRRVSVAPEPNRSRTETELAFGSAISSSANSRSPARPSASTSSIAASVSCDGPSPTRTTADSARAINRRVALALRSWCGPTSKVTDPKPRPDRSMLARRSMTRCPNASDDSCCIWAMAMVSSKPAASSSRPAPPSRMTQRRRSLLGSARHDLARACSPMLAAQQGSFQAQTTRKPLAIGNECAKGRLPAQFLRPRSRPEAPRLPNPACLGGMFPARRETCKPPTKVRLPTKPLTETVITPGSCSRES